MESDSFVIDYLFSLEINSFFFFFFLPPQRHIFCPALFFLISQFLLGHSRHPKTPFRIFLFTAVSFSTLLFNPFLRSSFFFFLLFEFLPREGRCNFVYNPQPVILHSRITNVEAFLSLLFHHGGFGITQGKSRIDYFLLSGGGRGVFCSRKWPRLGRKEHSHCARIDDFGKINLLESTTSDDLSMNF